MPRGLEIAIVIVSVAMFVGTIALIPWLVRRMPEDYFVRAPPKHSLAVKVGRNVLGLLLIAAGAAMLVLPGQGVLTILIGLSILDLPVKHRIMRRILLRPGVRRAVEALRSRAGKPPLVLPERPEPARGDGALP